MQTRIKKIAGAPYKMAFATASGSSGKTTSACTVAAILGDLGLRVLVVDCDWQIDATRWLGQDDIETAIETGDRKTLLDVLISRKTIRDAIAPSTFPGVDLLPAAPALKNVTKYLADNNNPENQLRLAVEMIEDDYHVIIFDLRAGLDLLALSGMLAAENIVCATAAGTKELLNAVELQKFVTKLADDYARPLKVVGFLACDVPAVGSVYQEALGYASEMFGDLLLPTVRRSTAVREAHGDRAPLIKWQRWKNIANDYRAVTAALSKQKALPPLPKAKVHA